MLDRREFLKYAGAGTAALFGHGFGRAADAPAVAQKAKRPNFIFVFADQYRRQAMGFMNQDPVITPNFDRFAQQSLVFNNAISSCPLCTPFRAMLQTGRFPLTTGMTGNCQRGLDMELNEKEVCFGDVLKASGYGTGYIGKWHLECPPRNKSVDPVDGSRGWDGWTPPGPRRHGFDFWYAYNTNGRHFNPYYWKDSPHRVQVEEWSVKHETDVAMDFIRKRDKTKPFALFVGWNPPHPPYVAPDEYKDRYDSIDMPARENVTEKSDKYQKSFLPYCAAVTTCDDNFGRLLDFLEDQDLAEDTIVVFSADHGDMMGSHGRFGKHIWYEESIGIPFLIRWPGKIKPKREDMLFASYNFMPTLLSLMGLPIPDTVEGQDYSAIMRGKPTQKPTSAFIANYVNPGKLMAVGQPPSIWTQKGVELRNMGIDWRKIEYRGVRTDRYTYIVDRGTDTPDGMYTAKEIAQKLEEGTLTRRLLYDNEKDPYQLNPITATRSPDHPVMARLEKELSAWLEKMNDPFLRT